VSYGRSSVTLTPIHFGIVWILAVQNSRPVPVELLCDQLFGNSSSATVDKCHAHISKTRRELASLGPALQVHCTVGVGYSLVCLAL
jgi:DNA-binding response OmpR family regulator